MFCKNCGNQLTDGVKFCPKCGANMESGVAQAATGAAGAESNVFRFNSTNTGSQSAFSLKHIPTDIALLFAAIVVIKSVLANGTLLVDYKTYGTIVVFVTVFLLIMGLLWPRIWRPRIVFNTEKKQLETLVAHSVSTIHEISIEKVVSVKRKKHVQTAKDAFTDCLAEFFVPTIKWGLGGLVLGFVLSKLCKIVPDFAGMAEYVSIVVWSCIYWGVLLGLWGIIIGLCLLMTAPGTYMTYLIEVPIEAPTEPDENKEDAASKKEGDDPFEDIPFDDDPFRFKVTLANPNDIPVFENFLKSCYEACGRTDFAIAEVE